MLTIQMDNPEAQLLKELEWPGITQASVALTYVFIIAQEPNADWPKLNAAIMNKWRGKSALKRVKEMAWKQVEEWQERRA